MSKRTGKHIYRPGDAVCIINPIFVERVGYPLIWPMLEAELAGHPKLQEAMRLLDLNPANYKVHREFLVGICKATVRQRHFGGKERTLHTTRLDGLSEHELEVQILSKRVVMTGIYYPPSGGQDYWTGEYDYQPGGLENAKAHVLLKTSYGEIEDINVEPVKIKAVEKIVA